MTGERTRYAKIPGYSRYMVGSDGSVWSRKTEDGIKRKIWQKLKAVLNDRSRPVVSLSSGGIAKRFKVQHLVLMAFVGPRPHGMVCCHFPDRDVSNCRLSNLSWGTIKKNEGHKRDHLTIGAGEQNSGARLSKQDVCDIRSLHASGRPAEYLADIFHVCPGHIMAIVEGKRWKPIAMLLPTKKSRCRDPRIARRLADIEAGSVEATMGDYFRGD